MYAVSDEKLEIGAKYDTFAGPDCTFIPTYYIECVEYIYAKWLFLTLNWPFLRKHDNPTPSINFHESLVKKTMCYSQIHKSHIDSITNLKLTKFQGFNPIKIRHK